MASRYRILHVIDHLGLGGAQVGVGYLLKYSQRSLFQVEVASLCGLGHHGEILRSWGFPVHTMVSREFSKSIIPIIFSKLCLFLAKNHYDVIHTHLLAANVLGAPAAALCRVPVRITHDRVHDDVRYRLWTHRWLDLLANRLNHHIIAVSASIRNFLCQEEGVSPDKVSVIHTAVDLERFSPKADWSVRNEWRRTWGLPEDAPVVGGVGRLHYQKNFPVFLEVAAEVITTIPGAVFVIAGEGPDRAVLEELTRKLGLSSRVRFLGFVKEMPEFYQTLDLLLLTSHFEGTPLTVLEALAMGLPVVASRIDGVAELLEDGQDAMLVPPENKQFFATQVCRLLSDRQLAQGLAQTGQEKVRKHHSAEAMVRRVENIYLKLLEGK